MEPIVTNGKKKKGVKVVNVLLYGFILAFGWLFGEKIFNWIVKLFSGGN